MLKVLFVTNISNFQFLSSWIMAQLLIQNGHIFVKQETLTCHLLNDLGLPYNLGKLRSYILLLPKESWLISLLTGKQTRPRLGLEITS